MANSTYFEIVNKILRRHGQETIADTSTFNTTASLNKTQVIVKELVAEADAMLQLDMPAEFLIRNGTITITSPVLADNTTGWALSCPWERVIENSFRIATSTYARRLEVIPQEEYNAKYLAGQTVTGIPAYVTPLPHTALDQADFVAFDPAPSTTLSVKYQYFHLGSVLAVAADEIVWPKRLEFLLIQNVGKWLEVSLSEGKAPEWGEMLTPVITKVRQSVLGFAETGPTVEIGLSIAPFRRGSRRSEWTYRE